MTREIKLKRLCQKEPTKNLIQLLLQQSHTALGITDSQGQTVLDWPGDESVQPAYEPTLHPIHGENGEVIGQVSGGDSAALVAEFMAFLVLKEREGRQLAQETLSKYKELTLLYELGEKIATCVDETELAWLTLTEVRALLPQSETMHIGVLLTEDPDGVARVCAGYGERFPVNTLVEQIDGITRQVLMRGIAEIVDRVGEDIRFLANPGDLRGISALIGVPLKTRDKVFGVLLVVSDASTRFNAAELKVLNLLASQVAVALGRVHLIQARVEQERLQESLELSRGIQMSMLPTGFPRFSPQCNVELYACMEPARQVGGDFYDFFYLDEKTLLIVIGDVSDKGMPAALFMVMVKTLIRAHAKAYRLPHRILTAVNPELCRDNDTLMFVTLFVATLEVDTGLVRYSFGGHNRPMLLQHEGSVRFLEGDTGVALGVMETATFKDQQIVLQPGEGLILYTDGVSEAMSHEQEEFGEERLCAVLADQVRLNAKQLVDQIMSAVQTFARGAEQSDDITLLAVRTVNPNVSA